MKLVLLGAPGSGKGTHSEYLEKVLNIPHISTGEIFREAIGKRTPLGLLAKSFIDYGNLVPDDVTIELVKERLAMEDCKEGFILDGFPRTLEQGKQLANFTDIDLVLYLNIELEVALTRLLNRRACKACGTIYNLTDYKKSDCERCGGELYVRDDDNKETITKRFDVYNRQTYPLIEYYKNKNILRELNVDNTVEENRKNILKVVGEFND
jgi:adenylate kinase